jgi:hypothetical protein
MAERIWEDSETMVRPILQVFGAGMLIAALPTHLPALGIVGAALLGTSFFVRTGFSLRDDGAMRKWWGIGPQRRGRWQRAAGELEMRYLKESRMNRRGAPNSVGTESWDLGWEAENGKWNSVHEFTDRAQAEEVATLLAIQIMRGRGERK